MNILIIDDNVQFIEKLKHDLYFYLVNIEENIIIDCCYDCFGDFNLEKEYDFCFCDISLVDDNGIDLIKRIFKEGIDTRVVFVSSYQNLIHETLRIQPYYFIRKTHYQSDLDTFFSILKSHNKKNLFIDLKYKNIRNKVSIKTIKYISSMGHQLTIITNNSYCYDNRTLNELEKELEYTGLFVRIHKSYLINMKHIHSINKGKIIMDDLSEITIGRVYKDMFNLKFQEYLLEC